jgi:ATP-binding cassette subfamily F protein 3
VRLAQLLLDKPNVLVLDEPTNHLDIASCEALERSLQRFPGTVLCVSHDRYFLDQVVNRLLVLQPPGLVDFPGTYGVWARKAAADAAGVRQKPAEAEKPKSKGAAEWETASKPRKDNPYARPFGRLTLEELERQITDTEIAIGECQAGFGDAAGFKDPSRGRKLKDDYKQLSTKLEALEAEYFAREV